MEVSVKVATILLGKADPPLESSSLRIELESGTTVEQLLKRLNLPEPLVGSVTVNNRRSLRDRVLEENDKVTVVPAISGG